MTMILIKGGTVMYESRVPKTCMLKELRTRIAKFFFVPAKNENEGQE